MDRASEVRELVLLDVLPERVVLDSFDRTPASAMWHLFFHLQPGLPELLVTGNVEAYLGFFLDRVRRSAVDPATVAQYVSALREPGHLHASFEDYRTGFSVDLALDRADHARVSNGSSAVH